MLIQTIKQYYLTLLQNFLLHYIYNIGIVNNYCYLCGIRAKNNKLTIYGRRENYIFDGWRKQGA